MAYRYIDAQGREIALATAQDLGRAVAAGLVTEQTLVFHDGRWSPASSLDLFATASAAAEASGTYGPDEEPSSVPSRPSESRAKGAEGGDPVVARSRGLASLSGRQLAGILLLLAAGMGVLSLEDGVWELLLIALGAGGGLGTYRLLARFRTNKAPGSGSAWLMVMAGCTAVYGVVFALAYPEAPEALARGLGNGLGLGAVFGGLIAMVLGGGNRDRQHRGATEKEG